MFSRRPPGKKELVFRELSVNRGDSPAVNQVHGRVRPGELMAVLGLSGCGKTSLMYALGGRVPITSGQIHLGGDPLGSRRQELAIVAADDIFLPLLTVKETVQYDASLRLPSLMSPSERDERADKVIEFFGLKQYIVLGAQFTSPMVKRRLSLACEMLTDPSVLLVDEPFSGLSFEESIRLTRNLKYLAESLDKIVVIATESVSSAIYQMCSKVIFLYAGEVVYSGETSMLTEQLQAVDITCPVNTNMADFVLELITSEDHSDDTSRLRIFIKAVRQWKDHCGDVVHNGMECLKTSLTVGEARTRLKNSIHARDKDEISLMIDSKPTDTSEQHRNQTRPTSFWNQLSTLTSRNFRNARRRILNPISILQNTYILVVCVLIWWRPERVESKVMDRMGLFFFTTVQWAFFALLDAVFTFPKELKVVTRERAQGVYGVTAYCLAKSISELPLTILQPCVYMCVMYWVANLNSVTAFVKSVGVVIADVYAAQSIGLFLGTVLNPPWTVTVMSLGLLSMMLLGGAFNTPPPWLQWGKYASFFHYGLQSFISLEFSDAQPIRCSENGSMIALCGVVDLASNTTSTQFPAEVVLRMNNIDWPAWAYVSVLLSVMLIMRVLWYIALRFYRKPATW
ncbi:ABC transporter G family member 21-like isoform X1 [Haliotis rufescens]|uniref:ABC transporter G family member 21-like isoform X1 n=2 Tax=Haliotis rufescens TaxID=6454 RepID=UPI00201EBE5B|nr:ABC transporter G family member 21-like isoform X1 [Haliotis rufescens]